MEIFICTGSTNTPTINWNPQTAEFTMAGKSFPENANKFYSPVMEWLDNFNLPRKAPIVFEFQMDYVSSSSIISILELLRKLEQANQVDSPIIVRWLYDPEDEDMYRLGLDYNRLVSIDFELASFE